MRYPKELRYNKEHIWVRIEGNLAYLGITDYAQDKLGEILFVEMPEIEEELEKGDEFAVVESSKKASTLFSPISGEVVEINEKLDDEPEYINEDPYDAWIVKIKIKDEAELDNLIDSDEYQAELK
ncbi:MAG: glycine cleavage system protein [Candidatus Petromonas sp.]|nr:glycine cleavage system protein [Candidatus Petromonas sp.]